MTVLRAAQHRHMPWKNGGGETTEIAVFPPGAGLDDFGWRISMARVASDGPFSVFAGIDRTLTLLDGDGLRLAIGEAARIDLQVGSDPLSFAADLPTHATLLGGAVTDLNVMTRRGRWRHRVTRLTPDAGGIERTTEAAQLLCLCHRGRVHIDGPEGSVELGPLDAWIATNAAAVPWRLRSLSPSELYWIELAAV